MADTVSCTFLNPTTKLIERVDIKPPTGHSPNMVSTRRACEAFCDGTLAVMFAIPSFVDRDGKERWLVFQRGVLGMFNLAKDWPNRDAAEMWMQHHG